MVAGAEGLKRAALLEQFVALFGVRSRDQRVRGGGGERDRELL
jgi:hypothetical protein